MSSSGPQPGYGLRKTRPKVGRKPAVFIALLILRLSRPSLKED